ncbi:hypothetical protein [Streptacidiphilus rugosus]|uniref:hypothetical protein n=1 Tax=Streptacidiphilus rugosus TaxID=405783 RepID=UPI0012F937C2|nr:hypothetical protein [Streptacidiphilus rugosus]
MSSFPLVVPAVIAAGAAVRALANRKPTPAAARGPKPVPIDLTFGDPELAALRQAVSSGNWPAAEAILQPCRDRGDHARLTWLIGGIEESGGNFLLELPRQHPDNPLVRTVSGARHVAWAWEARGRASGAHVSQDQFRIFHERLRTAEEHLYAAIELDPKSAAPWCSLTTSSRGLQHGHDVTRRRFEAGVRRAPHHVALHAQMLQQVCEKWGGSHEEMFAFARNALAEAPPGSAMGLLVAYAHLERWLDLPKGEDAAYIRGAEVRAELKAAAQASVLHPAFAPTESPYVALNAFAVAFWLAGERASATEMFRRIGDHPTRFPWAYVGDPARLFAKARQESKKRK